MQFSSVTLSIIIGTRNRFEGLKRCLNSLVGIQVDHEIIVIDAGSTDGTLEYLRKKKNVTLIEDGMRLGQAKSFNRVLKKINSSYFCWLSDDNVVRPNILDSTVHILKNNPSIGMVGLKTKDRLGPFSSLSYIGGIRANGVLTCNQAMLPLKVARDVEFFDEELGTYGIDPDLTSKVLLLGLKVVYTREVALNHFRDHVSAPGVFSNKERKLQQERSLARLDEKYRHTFPTKKIADVFNEKIWTLVSFLDELMTFFGIPEVKFLNFNLRDVHNVLIGRHISVLDFWNCRKKSFHLVQRLK